MIEIDSKTKTVNTSKFTREEKRAYLRHSPEGMAALTRELKDHAKRIESLLTAATTFSQEAGDASGLAFFNETQSMLRGVMNRLGDITERLDHRANANRLTPAQNAVRQLRAESKASEQAASLRDFFGSSL